MAVKLRLSRVGKKGHALYRVIAIDEHKKRDGQAIEILGQYDPHATSGKINIKKERVTYWLSVGATPTATVARLLKS